METHPWVISYNSMTIGLFLKASSIYEGKKTEMSLGGPLKSVGEKLYRAKWPPLT